MKVKKSLTVFISILFVIIILLMLYFNRIQISQFILHMNKKDIIKDISFDIYSYDEGIMKVLVVAEDTENKINQLKYVIDGKERILNANLKEKVAIDYEIVQDGEYVFKFINGANEEVQKTLVINNDIKDNLIKININPDRELGTVLNVNIEYSKNLDNTYKIGNSDEWKNYNGEFTVTSYDVLKNNYQDLEDDSVTIYAKTEDKVSNKIIISKKSINLDLKKAYEPIISVDKSTEYPFLTSNGVCVLTNVSIQYDDTYDVDNYYSLDNGNTWNIYNGNFSTTVQENQTSGKIMAKTVKKVSGLETVSEALVPLLKNSLDYLGYDGDENTYIESPGGDSAIYYLNIDKSAYLKQFEIVQTTKNQGSGGNPSISIIFYDEDGNIIGDEYYYKNVGNNYKSNIVCPYDASYMKFILQGSSDWGGTSRCWFKEINISNNEELIIVKNKEFYPIIKDEGIGVEKDDLILAYISYPNSYNEVLWKINENSDWLKYERDMSIQLTLNQTLYVKGVNENGDETEVKKYTAELANDAIQESAYDNDEDTFYLAGNATTKYINIDESAWGKKLKILSKGYQIVRFLDKDDNVLYSDTHRKTNSTYIIPQNAVKLKYYFNENGGIYEMMI